MAILRSIPWKSIWLAGFVMLLVVDVAWAETPSLPIKRLDDPTRVKVLAAVAGLIILGFAVVLLTWLGARVTQRYRNGASYFRPTPRPGEHDWAAKPLMPREPKPGEPNVE
jgi:hypothetical protein